MRASQRAVVLVAGVAAVISGMDVAGARWWRRTAEIASVDSTRATIRIRESGAFAVPEAVRRSRRLVGKDLATAPAAHLIAALDRVGTAQQAWFYTDPAGFKNAARAALIAGRLDDARRWIEGAVFRDPTSPALHRLLAYTLTLRGRREEALDHLAQARGLAPGFSRPDVSLTHEETLWVRAEGLQRARNLYPRQRIRNTVELARQLRLDGSEEEGRAALAAELPHPIVDLELAVWDQNAGLLDEAQARLDRVAGRAVNPASLRARAWAQMAEVKDLQGDLDGATEAAGRALALDPTSPAPHLALARLAERRGDKDGALAHLRRAWGLTPTDVRLLNRFSEAAEAAGELGDARLALVRAVELEPDSVTQAARLVDFQLRNGRYMEAALDLGRFLDRFPTDPTLLRLADRLQREVTR